MSSGVISQKIMHLINLQLNMKPQMWWAQVTAWADDIKAWRLMHCNLQADAMLSKHCISCFPIWGILHTKNTFSFCQAVVLLAVHQVMFNRPTLSDNEVCQVWSNLYLNHLVLRILHFHKQKCVFQLFLINVNEIIARFWCQYVL